MQTKKMTEKHYRITLWTIGISYLLTLPFGFSDIHFFKDLKADYPLIAYWGALISNILFWSTTLYYFHLRKWAFTFVTGLILGVSSMALITFLEFNFGYSNPATIFMLIATLIYGFSHILFGISFLVNSRTKELTLIRIYAILTFVDIAILITGPIIDSPHTGLVSGLFWTIESVILFLHFVYERNLQDDGHALDEVLDM